MQKSESSKEYHRAYYKNNKEYFKEYYRKQKKNNPERLPKYIGIKTIDKEDGQNKGKSYKEYLKEAKDRETNITKEKHPRLYS